jgi:hypothetical protein
MRIFKITVGIPFYMITGSAGKTATGMLRSSATVETRSLDIRTRVADTYANVDGQSLHVQPYRFTCPWPPPVVRQAKRVRSAIPGYFAFHFLSLYWQAQTV